MSPETIKEKTKYESTSTQPRDLGSTALQLIGEENPYELRDKRIVRLTPIYSPKEVVDLIPQSPESNKTVGEARGRIANIIRPNPKDNRLLVIVGPCSIHDTKAGLEYADHVADWRNKYSDSLEIVMRTYLEKPRTTTGWKGLINDPHLDGSFAMNEGLLIARDFLNKVTSKGVPVASELLYTNTPQRLSDLMSYGAIGARTTESQLHRELASGLSFPVGFKNGTGGSVQMAIDALKSAASPHAFVGIDQDGHDAIVETSGNNDCHIILRGSSNGPNYNAESVQKVSHMLESSGQNPAILIDTSHANSGKDYQNQPEVISNVSAQIVAGNENIRGVMIESNLVEGSQSIGNGKNLIYGQSVTDGCIGLNETAEALENLAGASSTRV